MARGSLGVIRAQLDTEDADDAQRVRLKATLSQALARNKVLERQEMWKMRREEDKGCKHQLSLKSNKGDVLSLAVVPKNASVTKNSINKYDEDRAKMAAEKENKFLDLMCDGNDHTWRTDDFFTEELHKHDVPWPVRPMDCSKKTNFAERIVFAYEASRALRRKKQKKKSDKKAKCKKEKKDKKTKKAKKEKKPNKKNKKGKKDKKLVKAQESVENMDPLTLGQPGNSQRPAGAVSQWAWRALNTSVPDPLAPPPKRSRSAESSPDTQVSVAASSDEAGLGKVDCGSISEGRLHEADYESQSEGMGCDDAVCESCSEDLRPEDSDCESSTDDLRPREVDYEILSEVSGETICAQTSAGAQSEAARWSPGDVLSPSDAASDAGSASSVVEFGRGVSEEDAEEEQEDDADEPESE